MTVLSFLTRPRPAPTIPQPSRDDMIRAVRRSRRLAELQARRQRVLPVRLHGAGVTLHTRFRRPSDV